MENHDKFNNYTVGILAHLYEIFPNQAVRDTTDDPDPLTLTDTIQFWQRCNMIVVAQAAETFGPGGAQFYGVGLTLPGLAALRTPWSNSAKPVTLGERMLELDRVPGPADKDKVDEVIDELLRRLTI